MIKKSIGVLLALCMLVSVFSVCAFADALQPLTNESEDYIVIEDYLDLYGIVSNMSGKYVLVNDIDMTEALKEGGDLYSPVGWSPIGYNRNEGSCVEFSGILDGNGHSICGFNSGDYGAALFWKNTGTIKNLTIASGSIGGKATQAAGITMINEGLINNCHNYADIIGSAHYAGGIAATNEGTGIITHCSNHGNISLNDSDSFASMHAGGIAGASLGTIDITWNTGSISVTSHGASDSEYSNFNRGSIAGGIVGDSFVGANTYNNSKITNSYNTGNITAVNVSTSSLGFSKVGGIIGFYGSSQYSKTVTVENCYNIGEVSATSDNGSSYAGLICGHCTAAAQFANCYYLATLTGPSIGRAEKGTSSCKSLSDGLMKRQTSFAGFDFDSVWAMGSQDYPYPILPAHIHKLNHVERVKETCTTDGAEEYWECTDCGKLFSDEKGQNEIKTPAVIDATGHKTEIKNAAKASCAEDGYTGDEVCSVCGKIIKPGEIISALGHKTELKNAKSSTCVEDGYTGDEVCTVCGVTVKTGEVIKAIGHKWDAGHITKEPTDTAEGEKLFTCTVCGETRTETIPALGHTHELTLVPKVNATCTKDGAEAYWNCIGCGKLFSDEQGKNEINAPVVIKAVGHKLDSGVITIEPTETAEGVKTFTCTVCGETITEPIPKVTPSTPSNPFVDVKPGEYYYDPVLWAVNHQPQITNGTSTTTFSPEATCTRGQVVTFLWRAKGCPNPTSTANPFKDVASDAYYYKAVLWANENGITNGTSANTFSPDAPCTRAQVVTFLWRTEGKPAAGGNGNPFVDVPDGQYYTTAVLWAVNHRPEAITNGTSANAFSPNATCTRGQIVTFLYRDMK